MKRLNASRALAGVAVVAALVAGCSTRKIAYGLADRLIVRAIDSAVDLTSSQRTFLQTRLTDHLAWHRRAELPKYVALLDQLRAEAAAPNPRRAEVARLTDQVQSAAERLVDRLAPDVATFIARLSPQQLDAAEKEMEKSGREEDAELALPQAEYVAARVKSLEKSARSWIGPLTQEQRDEAARLTLEKRDERKQRLEEFRQKRREMLAFLRGRPDAHAIETRLRSLFTWPPPGEDPAKAKAERERGFDEILRLAATLTEAQRARLGEELLALRTDFAELAADAPAVTAIAQ